MPTVLITQCLQRDFVGTVEPHEPLPNALHVGREESSRLLGPEPEHGPLAHLMAWARKEAPRGLHLVHVVDRHDADDPVQADHLTTFGRHCIRGTVGAELVLGLETSFGPNETLVEAVGRNDFEETRLPEVLRAIAASAPDEPMRVGLVGVWTDAKVTFLLYDLKTRFGVKELATSSALTASASRATHFGALDQLRRLLGIRVFDGVGEFASSLVPDGSSVEPVRLPSSSLPRLEVEAGGPQLDEDDALLVGYLHRHAPRVVLEPLSGGFSGAAVYRAQAYDVLGHALAPSVVKVGPREVVSKERVAFEQVEPVLGNHAPTMRGFADLGRRAAIRYAFASMGPGKVRTFKALFESGAEEAFLETVLTEVFETILGRFSAVAQYERLPLLEYYGFSSRWAPNVRERVAAVAGIDPHAERIRLPGGGTTANVAGFYDTVDALLGPSGESHYVSWVHGDLNGANILVDARDNVWVIDYFHAHRGHVLRDLAKLENDVLFLMTELADEAALEEHLELLAQLRSVGDLRAPLPESPSGIRRPELVRAYRIVRALRRIGAEVAREDRDPHQLRVALLRYAVHTLGFDEASERQKRAALFSGCALAEDVRRGVERNRGLRVDVVAIPSDRGVLGITLCPGRRDKARMLEEDLDSLVRSGTHAFLTFVTDVELEWSGVPDLVERTEARGIRAERFAIPDQRVPTFAEAEPVVDKIVQALARGEKVVLACMGGLGRSGMIAACVLVRLGLEPDEAIARVRVARGPRAVETSLQEEFVRGFARAPR